MKGQEVVRMVPWKDGQANRGHSCVKGRFAWLRHAQGTRAQAHDPPAHHRSVARGVLGRGHQPRGLGIPPHPGAPRRDAVGGITLALQGTWLVQKLVRAAFGTNNVDTCARVCHSPTGYGLKQTLGESAGTQTFDSVMHTDVVIVMGANPSSATGVRLAPEAPAAPGRAPDRDRSAPHRAGQLAAHQGRLPPGAARHQHGGCTARARTRRWRRWSASWCRTCS